LEDQDKKNTPSAFAQMFEESLKTKTKRPSVGDKVQGEVLVAGREDIFVAIGSQQEGIVPRKELLNENGEITCKAGDKLELYVTQIRKGEIFLSPKATGKALADDLEDAFDMMIPVEGRIVEVCNGGVRVSVKGKIAFCPISQLDTKFVENAEEYVGKKFEFQITQFSEDGRNLIVSRKKILTEENQISEASFQEQAQIGEIISGKITRLEKFGAFVEVAPGVDGLAHISELSHSRIASPEEVVQVGDQVQVKILKIENHEGRTRISLSLKQAGSQPWDSVPQNYAIGTVIEGKIEKRAPYGLFIQLQEGVTGLLPKSKAVDQPDFPFDKLKPGDAVSVRVAELDLDRKRISLSLPTDPSNDDWREHAGQIQTQMQSSGSFGGLADQLKKALEKKSKK
jgi:small subunit ribosomal protein S1